MTGRHGTGCTCGDCSHVEVALNYGRADEALHDAYAHGLVRDADIELAWRTGVDPLQLAGFTNRPVNR